MAVVLCLFGTAPGAAQSVPGPGRYRIRAQRIGYAATTSTPLDLGQSESVTVEFRVSAQAVPLAPITVVAPGRATMPDPFLERRRYYERERAYGREGLGAGYFLDGEKLPPNAGKLSDVLRDLRGFSVVGVGGSKTVIMGRRGCTPNIYLNGMPIRGDIEEVILPLAILAVEVYPGPVVPAEYIPAGFPRPCGAVVLWTGRRH